MHDYYLRADDEAAFDAAMGKAGLTIEGAAIEGVWIDCIGEISRITGADRDGEPIVETIAGYHANLRIAEKFSADQVEAFGGMLIDEPRNPVRVWA